MLIPNASPLLIEPYQGPPFWMTCPSPSDKNLAQKQTAKKRKRNFKSRHNSFSVQINKVFLHNIVWPFRDPLPSKVNQEVLFIWRCPLPLARWLRDSHRPDSPWLSAFSCSHDFYDGASPTPITAFGCRMRFLCALELVFFWFSFRVVFSLLSRCINQSELRL